MDKKISRMRRAARTRHNISRQGKTRLCVHRTPQHIYVQLTSEGGAKVLASASTLDKEVKSQAKIGSNIAAATVVGKFIAKRALALGIKEVAFDRSGFRYHGRIKALADAAREGGLDF